MKDGLKAKFFVVIPFALAAFGCSDLSENVDENNYKRKYVDSKEELLKYSCTKDNDGEQVVLTSSDRVSAIYECQDGLWVGKEKGDVITQEKSSSSKETSKEDEKSSSSSASVIPKSSSSRATAITTNPQSSGSEIPAEESSSSAKKLPSLGTCATTTGVTKIDKGTMVLFLFTANPERESEILQMQSSRQLAFTWDYGSGTGASTPNAAKSGVVTYCTPGPSGASVTITMGNEEERIPCDLYVNDALVTSECATPETSEESADSAL